MIISRKFIEASVYNILVLFEKQYKFYPAIENIKSDINYYSKNYSRYDFLECYKKNNYQPVILGETYLLNLLVSDCGLFSEVINPSPRLLKRLLSQRPSKIDQLHNQTIEDCLFAVTKAMHIEKEILSGNKKYYMSKKEVKTFENIRIVSSSSLEECYDKLLLKKSILNGL